MATDQQPGRSVWVLPSIAIVLSGLYLAKGVLVPMTLAVLLSFLLSPVCTWLERRGLGRIPAVGVTVLVGFLLLGAATWTVVVQVTEIAPRLPEYQTNLQAKLRAVNDRLRGAFDKIDLATSEMDRILPPEGEVPQTVDPVDKTYSVRVIPPPTSPLRVLSGTLGTVVDALGSAGIVLLLVAFFLVRREDLRDRFVHLIGQANLTVTTQALEDAATRVSHYLATETLLNTAFGLSIGTGLYFIGIPNAILLGMAATTLRFIPYLGPILAGTLSVGLSMAISTNWIAPLCTTGLFVAMELMFNNVLEPWLYGKNTGISAVAVLVAAIFWTWLWGSVGLLVATPLTVCLLVIGKHVPQLSFLNTLLGNEPVFELKTRVYQRLLAGDVEEADDLIEESLSRNTLAEVYDDVVIPALALAERDRRRGMIDEGRRQFIFQTLKDTIEDLGQRPEKPPVPTGEQPAAVVVDGGDPATTDTTAKPCLLLLPARDDVDELATIMLAQLIARSGFEAEIISPQVLTGELADLLARRQADVVCISAMPPGAGRRARYLCNRLKGRFPDERLIVGLWSDRGDPTTLRTRIGCPDAVRMVAALSQAHDEILRGLKPVLAQTSPEDRTAAVPGVPEQAGV